MAPCHRHGASGPGEPLSSAGRLGRGRATLESQGLPPACGRSDWWGLGLALKRLSFSPLAVGTDWASGWAWGFEVSRSSIRLRDDSPLVQICCIYYQGILRTDKESSLLHTSALWV